MAAVFGIKMACLSVSKNYWCVGGCKSKFSRKSGVWMHTFPKDSKLKKEWEVRLKLEKKKVKNPVTDSTIYTYFFSSCNLSSDKIFVLGQNNDIIVVVCD